jgi:hypothetical protein
MRMNSFRIALAMICTSSCLYAADVDPSAIRKSATLYASFDETVAADHALGDKNMSTRFNREKEAGKFDFDKGVDAKVFTIAKDKGISGGALQPVDVLPRNGRIYFPAKENIAFKKGGWAGSVSSWINTDPNKLLKTRFCDPVQVTEKGANNGGIWYDFNDAKPRDMRMGMFPFVAAGAKGAKEEDVDAPMVRVKSVGFKEGEWHHVVLTWKNFDSGKKDALATLYIDGKAIGEVKDREIAMNWDIDKAGIYVAISYIGLLDEFAIFDRALSADEVAALQKAPGLLQELKAKK